MSNNQNNSKTENKDTADNMGAYEINLGATGKGADTKVPNPTLTKDDKDAKINTQKQDNQGTHQNADKKADQVGDSKNLGNQGDAHVVGSAK